MEFDFSGVTKKSVVITLFFCVILFALGLYLLFAKNENGESKSDVHAQPKIAKVLIGVTGFEPSTLTVEKGTTVIFVNKTQNSYWLSSSDASSSGFGTEGILSPNQSYSYVYNEAGTWNYHEQAYGKFKGRIIVEE